MSTTSKKPKVAVIGIKGLPAFVGAGTVGEHLINMLKDEFDFYVYSVSSHTDLKSGEYNGVYQKVFPKLPFLKLNGFWYYFISGLHARFFGKYDLIHLHNSFAAFTLFFLKPKYKVVITTHGSFIVREKWKNYAWFWTYNTNKLVKKADEVCCVSQDEKRKFKSNLNLDVTYIPNGIIPIEEKTLPEVEFKEPYIFFSAGRIIPSKGLHDLIKALHIINYKGKVLVTGDMKQMTSYSKEIEEMIGDLDIQFLGLIKEKAKLLAYMHNAQFLVFPSHIEAMSMVLLEAVSVSCPVVCSDIIENKDIINEDEVLFFKTKDEKDLAEKIAFALENKEEIKQRSIKAKERFLNEYSWKTISDKYRNIFREQLK